MATKKLTATMLAGLKPPSGRRLGTFFDETTGSPPGFAFRVTAGGSRAFYLVFREPGPDQRKRKKTWFRLGELSEDFTLADAREAAREAYAKRRQGLDPKRERYREEQERQRQERERDGRVTLAGLVSLYIEAAEATGRISARTAKEYRRISTAYVRDSARGGTAAADARPPDIDAWLRELATERGPVMAINTFKVVRAAYRYGFKKELVPSDTGVKLDRPAEEKRLSDEERTLTDDEAGDVWIGVEALGPAWTAFYRTPLLLGTRKTETALMDWSQIDLQAKTLTLPPEQRKGGERGLVLPLPPVAVTMFETLKGKVGGNGPVFGGAGAEFLRAADRRINAARRATGVEDFSLHDLRATAGTGIGNCGAAPHLVTLLLGQANPYTPRVTGRYDRADRSQELAAPLTAWCEKLVELGEAARVRREQRMTHAG